MVHALMVARRLLRPAGIVVDLRPDRFANLRARHHQVYCVIRSGQRYAGQITIRRPLAEFRLADRAVREVVRRGLFRLEAVEVFERRSYADSPAHLEKAVAVERYAVLDDPTRRRMYALARRHPGAKIVVVTRERLSVLART